MTDYVDIIDVAARVAHEVNRAYCRSMGDESQPHWDLAPEWQKASARSGVWHRVNNPEATPADSHANWLKDKLADGWAYGPVKDPAQKLHPCMVPYDELPLEQQVKDALFIASVASIMTALGFAPQRTLH